MCLDQVWVAWQDGFVLGEAPHVTNPGVAYMLAEGSAASNTDPFAMKPAPGDDWVTSPRQVDAWGYPKSGLDLICSAQTLWAAARGKRVWIDPFLVIGRDRCFFGFLLNYYILGIKLVDIWFL